MNMITIQAIDAISYSRMHGYSMNDPLFSQNINGPSETVSIPSVSSCPCCHKVLADILMPVVAVNNAPLSEIIEFSGITAPRTDVEFDVLSVYRCAECNQLFAVWSHHRLDESGDMSDCDIIDKYPFDSKITIYSDDINSLSPEFVLIYNQAEQAEHQRLDEICGMGYRKALEFLVDAYIKKIKQLDDIPEKELSKKINVHIKNPDLRELAEKATWLGNDATHIVNKHPDRGVPDMKKFINQMVKWIDYELSVADAKTIEKR